MGSLFPDAALLDRTGPLAPAPARLPFNRPPVAGGELAAVRAALASDRLSGDGPFGRRCEAWFAARLGAARTYLTPSCTHSLEMAAMLLDLTPGDEVIMPSYTFVSTANAFVLHGARIVFVDVRPETMNLDERLVEAAITPRTRAIVPVHYGGVGCEMDAILDIARAHDLMVIEDAAQAVGATWKGRPLGAFGEIGAFSFHETKNLTSGGEGGLTILRDDRLAARAEVIREKGTDRSRFFRGEVDKYSWVGPGSSLLLNEISAACLWAQIEASDAILSARRAIVARYRRGLGDLAAAGRVAFQEAPDHAQANGHLFYIKLADLAERTAMIAHLKAAGIQAAFHYVPLHSSEAGRRFGRFAGEDRYTTRDSERLLRLPVFHGLTRADQDRVITSVQDFFAPRALRERAA